MLPYSRQSIDDLDIQAVVEVLKSDWLTTGPMVSQFESAVAKTVSANHAVAFCNGTAALHATMAAIDIQPGDEVIVPAITFVATANAVVYCGGTPVFADIDPETVLVDLRDVVRKISSRTKAIIAVDYAGQTCDYAALRQIADQNDLKLIADSCHSISATSSGRHVPLWADMVCYSFHPVKPMTTCEGGMVATCDPEFDAALRQFRNHGIATDHYQRARDGQFVYDMQSLGFNYRLSDVHCALGLTQLQRLPVWTKKRAEIAGWYQQLLSDIKFVRPLKYAEGAGHAHHLFVVTWDESATGVARDVVLSGLRDRGILANIHYRPVYDHSFYRQLHENPDHSFRVVRCPNADAIFPELISLPLFPAMLMQDVKTVVDALKEIATQANGDSNATRTKAA